MSILIKSKPTKADIQLYIASPIPFAQSGHIYIQDTITGSWIKFDPWPVQLKALEIIHNNPKIAILKARQLGLTWLCLIYVGWRMWFRPISNCGIFSIGGREAKDALKRLRGIYNRMPRKLQAKYVSKNDSVAGIWQLCDLDGSDEGSIAHSLPSTGGEGLSLNLLLCDEAGRCPDYKGLIGRVAPAVNDAIELGDGKQMAVGIFDKEKPNELFRQQLLDGLASRNGWTSIFFPWYARPDRTMKWFTAKKTEMLEQHGSDDMRKQQYPETKDEALSAPESDRRISDLAISRSYRPGKKLNEEEVADSDAPIIPGLRIYELPIPGKKYVATADPSEGLPNSDPAPTVIWRVEKEETVDEKGKKKTIRSAEQVCVLHGIHEPSVHAGYTFLLCNFYNGGSVLPERNNHGHAFIVSMIECNSERESKQYNIKVMDGPDGRKGWPESLKNKTFMYDTCVKLLMAGRLIVVDEQTKTELEGIKSSTLKCQEAEGVYDDLAICTALAGVALDLMKPNVSWGMV